MADAPAPPSDTGHVPLGPWPRLAPEVQQDHADALLAALRGRRAVRSFADTPVPRALIETLIATAGTAPSGANHQPWFFACIESPALKRRIREAAEAEEQAFYAGRAGQEWLDALAPIGTDWRKPYLEIAPWLVVIFTQRRGGIHAGDDKKNYYIHESVGIATGMLLAAAHTAGLASLVHTPNPMQFLNGLCGRPETEKPFLILTLGYPAADATVPRHALVKKPLEAFASFL